MATKKAAPKPKPKPEPDPLIAYEYAMVTARLDEPEMVLDPVGAEGWRAVAVVGRGVDDFQVLMQRRVVPKPDGEDDQEDL
jgi:hypothetical protein